MSTASDKGRTPRGTRSTRQSSRVGPLAGRSLELDVGPVAHGGHCVARYEGRVVFVRHALPGERVVARVTEDSGGSYCRADAVRILSASPDRVEPPCPHAGPGRCGGCDWQHVRPDAQRELKAAVIREQLARLGGRPDLPVVVEDVAGGPLGWRTRAGFAVDEHGRAGLRRHRSRRVEPVEHCPLTTPAVDALGVTTRRWPGASRVEAIASTGGDQAIVVTGPASDGTGPETLREVAAGRSWRVSAGVFWQIHPRAASALASCVVRMARPAAGETALDLYCGAGLFAGTLAAAVGETGRVIGVEGDARAVADAKENLAEFPGGEVRHEAVTGRSVAELGVAPDIVVLDPPRAGAGREVIAAVCDLEPRAVVYVGCDPAAFARDVRVAAGHGYDLTELRAFDVFPMTHHVECVGLFTPAG